MLLFTRPEDICNRGLQHVGATRIGSLDDDSRNASECKSVYDHLRQAELRRNVWRFSIRTTCLRPVNSLSMILGNDPSLANTVPMVSMLLCPPVFDDTVTYPLGSVVADSNGSLWQSAVPNNLNGCFGKQWKEFFGSLQVNPYDTTGQTSYYPGELVYEVTGPGLFDVYVSLAYTSTQSPGVPFTYSATTVYYASSLVLGSNGETYFCLQNNVLGVDPTTEPAEWRSSTNYSAAAEVAASDGMIYLSIASNNIDNNPANGRSPAFWIPERLALWTPSFSPGLGSAVWQPIDAEVSPIEIMYPAGTGPQWQAETRNVFLLPNNYLRQAPQDPKAGSNSYLGAPSGNSYNDWEFQGDFIISQQATVINLRFAADTSSVPSFDPMFCEGLGARIGLEVCETLTQSSDKWQRTKAAYEEFMREAREVNGIETGPTEPPEDDYLACRV